MMVFETMRDGKAAYHLPGHRFFTMLGEVCFQRGFPGREGERAEADFSTVAAVRSALGAPFAVGQGVDTLVHRLAVGILADFIETKQAIIACRCVVDYSVRRCIPNLTGVLSMPPYRLRHILHGGFAAAGLTVEVKNTATEVQ